MSFSCTGKLLVSGDCSCATAFSRQRVRAALGAGFSVAGRREKAVTPLFSAASCRRRLAVSDMSVSSPTTAATWPDHSPSSMAQSVSASRCARTRIICSGSMPNCRNAGPYRAPASSAQGRSHQRIDPFPVFLVSFPASRAQKAVPMPASAANTSCSAPQIRPPPGKCWSISSMPKGRTWRFASARVPPKPSSFRIWVLSRSRPAGVRPFPQF